MFSAHTIHVLHVVLRDTLIFFIVLFVALFMWLKVGIHVDELILGKHKIEGLYIKLDKKLTLKAHNIVIPKTRSKTSFQNIDRTFDYIKYLFTFFHYIELERVDFKNNDYQVIFSDNILYITSDEYEIAGNIERVGQQLIADVSMLYIKKEDINIVGKLTYFLQKDRLETEGAFDAYNIKGNFAAFKENDMVSFAVKSDTFTDLRTVIDKTTLAPVIKSWIVDKVQAKRYKLHSLVGKGNVENDGFKMDFDSLRGEALVEDVKIYYKEKLAPVLADNLILTYKNGGLYFDLKHPRYKDRNLEGSKVSIIDLIGKKPTTLVVDLHIRSVIDSVVHEILRAYDLQIPVTQKENLVKVDVKIDVPLKKSAKKTSVFVNVDLEEGDVYIEKVKLPVVKGNVQYDKGFITLKDIDLKESWYEGRANGKINLKAKKVDLVFDAKQISIGEKKEKFFILKNKKLPLTLDYSKNIIAEVPTLKLKIINHPDDMLIKVGAIEKLKPYLKDLGVKVDGGNLDITTKDFETYSFEGELKRDSCFIYDNNLCHTRIPCKGTLTKNGLNFYAFDDRLNINVSKSLIKLKNLNIDLKELFLVNEKNKKSTENKNKKIVIVGKKSKLRYGEFTLVTDSYNIEIKQNGDIKAIGSLDGDIVKLTKKGTRLSIQALRMKDKMLHPLINFDGLKRGRYTFKSSGDPEKVMKGQIIIEGGVMSDFKAYNNTLAFINTVPALATLSSPGFSEKGFNIEEGIAKYRKIGDRVIFDSIYVKGKSATIVGKGELDLEKNIINMDMAIQTAREFGKAVGSIPLLGYILMGEDKSMTVGLQITGSLDKPKVQTSAAKEILTLPLDILKRTIQAPTYILNKKKTVPKKEVPLQIKKPTYLNVVAP